MEDSEGFSVNENLSSFLVKVADITSIYKEKYNTLKFSINKIEIDETTTIIIEVHSPQYIIAHTNPIFDEKNMYFLWLKEIFFDLNNAALESLGERDSVEDLLSVDYSKLTPKKLNFVKEYRRLIKSIPNTKVERKTKSYGLGAIFSFETLILRFESSFSSSELN